MSSLLFLKFFGHRVPQNFAEKRASGLHYPNSHNLSLQFAKKRQLNSGKVINSSPKHQFQRTKIQVLHASPLEIWSLIPQVWDAS